MKLANMAGRLCLVVEKETSDPRSDGTLDAPLGYAIDVADASGRRFGPDPQAVYEQWAEFVQWAATVNTAGAAADNGSGIAARPLDRSLLGPPVPAPRQIFAIALNYRAHAEESGFALPERPAVFTKFASSLTGPFGEIALPEGDVDWEIELVTVIGRRGHRVPEERAWEHVAGLMIGQDISERRVQLEGPAPQFSMGKSFPGFSPTGPWLVTPDELANPSDLALGCSINGEQVQKSRTSDLIFSVPTLIARLSEIVTLLPGDLVFTGTPAGVGLGRSPQRFLAGGDQLDSAIEGLGQMQHVFVAADA
ncbi:MAG: fumarylacetoacetate hydrolase family protein [Pseudonocardia sp.]|jgi:2-keto-4-pentenoate hydratase/2-oxohepta-3-ene-1,7-dioic acid hydratase in catechol pathway